MMNKLIQRVLFGALVFMPILAIHGAEGLASKDKLYTGKEFCSAFAMTHNYPSLPNVLLIGDSISIGYTLEVRKFLKGKADVFRIPLMANADPMDLRI